MEYADGGDLQAFLEKNPLNWREESQKYRKYQLAFDITNGLHYLHRENIIHRDLVGIFFSIMLLNMYIICM